ncbi:MAG: VOC family protein [Thermoleophilia bacterium]
MSSNFADRERAMRPEGIHHISAITADAPANVDFYARVMGLRMVKRTVNQDDPTVYHLFYGDEHGSPGADLTFFEYPGAPRGRAGAGMVHRIVWRVADRDSLEFWADRLGREGIATATEDAGLVFSDPEGLQHELVAAESPDDPLMARHTEVPEQYALRGFHAVRAYAQRPDASRGLLEGALGFAPHADGWEARGDLRGSLYILDSPPPGRRLRGAGTVHHVAWGVQGAEIDEWRRRVERAGARPTPVIDRYYFRSVYFLEPSGVMFELATMGPGFAVDEDPEHLGEGLVLPPAFAHLRESVEPALTALPDVRRWRPTPAREGVSR